MNRNSIGIVSLVLAVIILLAGSPLLQANNVTVTETASIGSQPTDWTSTFTIPKFDSAANSGGTLTSVEVQLSSNMSTTISVLNLSGSFGIKPQTSTGSLEGQSTLTVTDPLNLISPSLMLTSPVFAFKDLASGSGTTSAALMQSGTSSFPFGTAAVLSEFTGTGSISLTASTASGVSNFSAFPAVCFPTVNSSEGLTATVVYTYTTLVPEPSSLAILGAGAVGLAGCTWRRWRKRSQ